MPKAVINSKSSANTLPIEAAIIIRDDKGLSSNDISTDQSNNQNMIESQRYQIEQLQVDVNCKNKDAFILTELVAFLLRRQRALNSELEQLKRQNHFFSRLVEQEVLKFLTTAEAQPNTTNQQVTPSGGNTSRHGVLNRSVLSHVVGYQRIK